MMEYFERLPGAALKDPDAPDVFSRFDTLFLSYETGHYKSSPGAHRHVVSHYEGAAGDIRFYDDSAANIEAARSVGLDARLTRGAPDL